MQVGPYESHLVVLMYEYSKTKRYVVLEKETSDYLTRKFQLPHLHVGRLMEWLKKQERP